MDKAAFNRRRADAAKVRQDAAAAFVEIFRAVDVFVPVGKYQHSCGLQTGSLSDVMEQRAVIDGGAVAR
jgi:hypothetical protein